MVNVKITQQEIAAYKREVLDQCVLVCLDETAGILGVSRSTVLRRAKEGRITAYSDNSTDKGLRFLASELKQYVSGMRRTQYSVE